MSKLFINKWNKLTNNEKNICKKIMSNPEILLKSSDEFLTQDLFISRTTFHRFTKKFDLTPKQFKIKVISDFLPNSEQDSFLINSTSSIEKSLHQLSKERISILFRWLFKSKNIMIFGEGINRYLSYIISLSLNKINIKSHVINEFAEAIIRDENDVLILISYSSTGKNIQHFVDLRKKFNCKLIVISQSNKYKKLADLYFQIFSNTSDKVLEREMQINSKYGILAIFDKITSMVLQNNSFDQNKKIKEQWEKFG